MKNTYESILSIMYDIHSVVSSDTFEQFFEKMYGNNGNKYEAYQKALWSIAQTSYKNYKNYEKNFYN